MTENEFRVCSSMAQLCGADARHLNRKSRAVFVGSTRWPNGETIRIAFLGGTEQQQAFVKTTANRWLKYVNLNFEWNAPVEQSDVRVAFEKGKGSWSFMGRQARSIGKERATMNLGWLAERPSTLDDAGTVLHEFGHMLGLAHEHCSPNGGLTWRRDVVLKSLGGPPNNWSEATITANVLNKYTGAEAQLVASSFDRSSIMLYSFPAAWTVEGIATRANNSLSRQDKLMVSQMYPRTDGGEITVEEEETSTPTGCCCGSGVFQRRAKALVQRFKKK